MRSNFSSKNFVHFFHKLLLRLFCIFSWIIYESFHIVPHQDSRYLQRIVERPQHGPVHIVLKYTFEKANYGLKWLYRRTYFKKLWLGNVLVRFQTSLDDSVAFWWIREDQRIWKNICHRRTTRVSAAHINNLSKKWNKNVYGHFLVNNSANQSQAFSFEKSS